jgi:hypothetical protein
MQPHRISPGGAPIFNNVVVYVTCNVDKGVAEALLRREGVGYLQPCASIHKLLIDRESEHDTLQRRLSALSQASERPSGCAVEPDIRVDENYLPVCARQQWQTLGHQARHADIGGQSLRYERVGSEVTL